MTLVNGQFRTNEFVHVPKVDEVCRWVSYVLVDGEIAWRYMLNFKAHGSLDDIDESRCDAKEYDPKYQPILQDVRREVQAEMKQKGDFGKFGSIHNYWHFDKERLKAMGIEWRSPAELNPYTRYD